MRSYGAEHAKPGLIFAPDALRDLSARDLELTDGLAALPPQTLKDARESVEREMVQDALRYHGEDHICCYGP